MRGGALLLLALSGCASAGGGAAAGALANVALASGVGGARVASGECFTLCPAGTTCNLRTRLCDALPCHARCGARQVCDRSGTVEHCVDAEGLAIQQRATPAPETVPVNVAPPLSASPPPSPGHLDVPAAAGP